MIKFGCSGYLVGVELIDDNETKLSKSPVWEIIKEDLTVAGGLQDTVKKAVLMEFIDLAMVMDVFLKHGRNISWRYF